MTNSPATRYGYADSPVGALLIVSDGDGLTGLYLPTGKHATTPAADWVHDDDAPPLPAVREQLGEYFAGERREFDVPLSPRGSAFQLRVWEALREIGYGETMSYGKLAATIGHPGAARAVGLTNGQNPISIIVPCHRVIGANGSLTGYGGGLPAKQLLLSHEAAHSGLFA